MPIEWVVPMVAVLVLGWGVIIRGRLNVLQEAAVQAWAGVDEVLRRRHGLVTRLAEAVKERAARDKRTLDGMLKARALATSRETPADISKAEAALGLAIGKVFEVVDEKPELRADPGLQRLKAEFSLLDGHILRSVRQFNEAAQDYNEAKRRFPAALLTYVIPYDTLQHYTVAEAAPQAEQRAPARL